MLAQHRDFVGINVHDEAVFVHVAKTAVGEVHVLHGESLSLLYQEPEPWKGREDKSGEMVLPILI